MTPHEIINSGLLETYAFGLATPSEAAEVEKALATYPEVAAELEAVQAGLEQYALLHRSTPPEGLKNDIKARLTFRKPVGFNVGFNEYDLGAEPPAGSAAAVSAPEPSSAPPASEAPVRSLKNNIPWYFAAAACLLLVASGAGNYFLFQNAEQTRLQLAEALEKNEDMATEAKINLVHYRATLSNLSLSQEEMAVLSCPTTKKVELQGQKMAPGAAVMVWYRPGDANKVLSAQNLPAVPDSNQYQLWAIVSGKPVDMGVFTPEGSLHKMTLQAEMSPDAFAVTVEKRGGSPEPNMDRIVAMGKAG